MFDTKKTAATRVADAADLVIDFATLGEYGLEPVDAGRPCEGRHRPGSSQHRRLERRDRSLRDAV